MIEFSARIRHTAPTLTAFHSDADFQPEDSGHTPLHFEPTKLAGQHEATEYPLFAIANGGGKCICNQRLNITPGQCLQKRH
jgi:hypothetical protein